MADFSVFLSFGGMGAYYLSSHTQTRGNLLKSIIIMSLIFLSIAVFVEKAVLGIFRFKVARNLAKTRRAFRARGYYRHYRRRFGRRLRFCN